MKERRRGVSTTASRRKRDVLSALPDDVIYDILARLRSPKQIAQAAVLSKRWADLWRSYPILEFYDKADDYLPWAGNLAKRHATAVLNKFSKQPYLEAVRIAVTAVPPEYKEVFSAFVNGVLDLAAINSPREIDIDCGKLCRIPESFFLSPCRLRVLKLRKCSIDNVTLNSSNTNSNPFPSFGSSLKVLSLNWVRFSDDLFLNSMIEAASLLENLSLVLTHGLRRLHITNHSNLKALEVNSCSDVEEDFKIIGAHSLEILRLEDYDANIGDPHVSSTPNVKVLHLKDVLNLTDEKLNKLISEFPSLETLVLDKLYPPPIMIKIDAPSFNSGFHELKQFVVKSCQFRLTLHFTDQVSERNVRRRRQVLHRLTRERGKGRWNETRWNLPTQVRIPWDQVTDKQSIPTIECVTFKSSYVREKENFLDIMFWVCHPKSLYTLKGEDSCDDFLSTLEYMCKQFMERGSNNHCTAPLSWQYWRHQLKDVKIVTTTGKDKPVNISSVIISSLVKQEQIWFILDWN